VRPRQIAIVAVILGLSVAGLFGARAPWGIVGVGVVLAALAAALGVVATRRARAQSVLDRIFELSPDVIGVATFEGYFTRLNPAAEEVLGHPMRELLERPYLDFVHPDDRDRTFAEATAIAEGRSTRSFENRYVRKDGSVRVLEWTSMPVVEEGVTYGIARDVTERRRAEAEAERLATEQAALRRVATLVATGASQVEIFTAVAQEIANLVGAEEIRMLRYEDDDSVIVVAGAGEREDVFPVGLRVPLGGDNATTRVARTRAPVRIDNYLEAASGPIAERARPVALSSIVATPILVQGRLWGTIVAGTLREERLPSDTESRLTQFTELMATAIANTESHARAKRLADEQAALWRVATLVAEGAPPTAVFDAVAAETEGLLGADRVSLSRYEPDAEISVLAHRGSGAELVPTGSRLSHEGDNVQEMVRRTERPARMENFDEAQGEIADVQRTMGVRGVVAVPVVLDGRVWGVIGASWVGEESPPVGTEERMAQFARLLATAIANAESRDQLTASRARLVTEGDAARRRLARDLHDGAQQRLVQTIVRLKLAQQALGEEDDQTESLLREALEEAEESNRELRELAHGILPAALTRGGLRAGVDQVVARLDVPVEVDLPGERFTADVEASAYFIVAEALTNVVKHAQAEHAEVSAAVEDGVLRVQVRDDGSGGADPDGHGLVGMADRVTALGGRLEIDSPPGEGTRLAATLPLNAG